MPDWKFFDSWELLAWLLDQPAADPIEALIQRANEGEDLLISMSWINLGEVYYMASRKLDGQRNS